MPNTRGPHGPPILQDAASHLWRVLALRKLLPRLLQPQVKRQLQWFRGSDPLQLGNVSKLINTWDILAAHSAYSQNDVVQVLQIQYQDPPVDRCSFNQACASSLRQLRRVWQLWPAGCAAGVWRFPGLCGHMQRWATRDLGQAGHIQPPMAMMKPPMSDPVTDADLGPFSCSSRERRPECWYIPAPPSSGGHWMEHTFSGGVYQPPFGIGSIFI